MELASFRDRATAQRILDRVRHGTGIELPVAWAPGNPDPDAALAAIERWLVATGSSSIHASEFAGHPKFAEQFARLLGSSSALADVLAQNPEFASLLSDRATSQRQPTVDSVVAEGSKLLAASTSYSHSLDRLRLLKQQWMVRIANADLSSIWEPEAVWNAISVVAIALVRLTLQTAWKEFSASRELPDECPVAIVAFGKLGGRELNYSSDIDLAYLHEDGIDERVERELTRFCEHFGQAVTNRMGRGSLYRVDLRLRPYGRSGPIIRSIRSYEAYYELYAESWEQLALIRSEVIAGPRGLTERWSAMRIERAFRPSRAESAFDELVENWRRTRESAPPSDLKRAPGGIRDIEFLVQIQQWLRGYEELDLRVLGTLQAAAALGLSKSVADAYRFLRQLEHRIQLAHDLQTHEMPDEPLELARLASLMGLPGEDALTRELADHKRTMTLLVRDLVPQLDRPASTGARAAVKQQLGELGNGLLGWFESLPQPDSFYAALLENRNSLDRVRAILERAPSLVEPLREDLAITERVISGEVEEDIEPWNRVGQLGHDSSPRQFAESFRRAWLTIAVQYALAPESDLGDKVSNLFDAALAHLARRLQADFSILALGSYGARDMSFNSDADLILLVASSARQSDAEAQAQDLLSLVESARRFGAGLKVDLRLRPDGGKGLLVRTYDGFAQYELEHMEMWERFALGSARLVHGDPRALTLVRKAAHAQPLTPERLKELVAMKKRIENERVSAPYQWREVKLGHGSLSDLEWLVHLHEMRYPTATDALVLRPMVERIRQLGRARLLTTVEVEELLEAREHLHHVRAVLYLLGYPNEMLPENPDKLLRIARQFGKPDANAFLAYHEPLVARLHAIFAESRERLRA